MLEPRFVESIPELIADGLLYISVEFRTTMHRCCCGCGNNVVLPLRPSAWRFSYDGSTVSMAPSVGNWSFPCRSHYWIRESQIEWAPAWTDTRIARGRADTLMERASVSTASVDPGLVAGGVDRPSRGRRLVRFLQRVLW